VEIPTTPIEMGFAPPHTLWRPHQRATVQRIVEAPARSVLVVSAPTGAGKTLIALAAAVASGEQTTILTHQRALQAQYMEHELEPPIRLAVGRANHPCILSGVPEGLSAARAPCTEGFVCPHATADRAEDITCPYYRQRELAAEARIRVLNYPLLFLQTKQGRFKSSILVCDEGHRLDKAILTSEMVSFSARDLELARSWKLGIPDVPDGTRLDDSALPAWAEAVRRHAVEVLLMDEKLTTEQKDAVRGLRESAKRVCTLHAMHVTALWRAQTHSVVPVLPEELAQRVLLRALERQQKLVVMSASIFDAAYQCARLGAPAARGTYIDIPSAFPVDRRPIFIRPVARMNVASTKDPAVLTALADTIDGIIEKYAGRRGVVHSGSFALGREIAARSRYAKRMVLAEPGNNHVDEFIKREGAVYVSPSAYEGYDFKDDLCRFNIVAKVSWPNRGDPVTALQLKLIPGFNEYEAASALVQAAGRGMRHDADWCHSYILDESVNMLLGRTKDKLPSWFKAALQWGY
jgi:ATP-dependent DNA helicase DinG